MPADPLKLFDSESIAAAALYAKQVSSDTADLYPVLVDAAGNLCVNMTVGTISLSSTESTINNSPSNPVNVTGNINIASATLGTVTTALASTIVTVHISPSGSRATVSLASTVVTVKSAVAGFNVNIATATLGTVTTSLASTIVTSHISPSASVVTVHISPSASAVTAALSNTNVTVNIGRVLTGCTVSISATTGTVTTAGTNRIKVYAVSVTTTATTSSVITFVNGTYGGMVLWRAVLQAPSGANAGLNLAVTPPAYLFATSSATLLRANLSASIPIEVAVSFFDEA